jgi:hypothetical protein
MTVYDPDGVAVELVERPRHAPLAGTVVRDHALDA